MFYILLAKCPVEKRITSLSVVGYKELPKIPNNNPVPEVRYVRPTVICGLSIRCSNTSKNNQYQPSSIETLNDQNKKDSSPIDIMEIAQAPSCLSESMSCLYLVVYDFSYSKEQADGENENVSSDNGAEVMDNKKENLTAQDNNFKWACYDYKVSAFMTLFIFYDKKGIKKFVNHIFRYLLNMWIGHRCGYLVPFICVFSAFDLCSTNVGIYVCRIYVFV